MTGRKRILATIAHQEPDRLPIAPRVWAWLMDYYGDASPDGYLGFRREFGSGAIGSVIGPRPNYFRSYAETYHLPDVEVEQRVWPGDGCRARRRAARPLTAPTSLDAGVRCKARRSVPERERISTSHLRAAV